MERDWWDGIKRGGLIVTYIFLIWSNCPKRGLIVPIKVTIRSVMIFRLEFTTRLGVKIKFHCFLTFSSPLSSTTTDRLSYRDLPQDNCFCPLLFNVYITPICNSLISFYFQYLFYANYIILFSAHTHLDVSIVTLNQALNSQMHNQLPLSYIILNDQPIYLFTVVTYLALISI